MALVLAFFFLQKDLGPALVLSCVVMALYAIARGRVAFVFVGFGMLLAGFACGVRDRLSLRRWASACRIWVDPWNNGVPGGNQIAHGLWALATGATWGSGPGLGSPQSIPAGHTDFVLAALGEELGFVGVAGRRGALRDAGWRCLRVALRAPGDYTRLARRSGSTLALVVQAFVIGSGLLGCFPLAGVVTPVSELRPLVDARQLPRRRRRAGRRETTRAGPPPPARRSGCWRRSWPLSGGVIASRAPWVQVVEADTLATASSLSEQADGGYRFEYNPRLVAAARRSSAARSTIATAWCSRRAGRRRSQRSTSRLPEGGSSARARMRVGRCALLSARRRHCSACSATGIGRRTGAARNASYVERDSDARLKGFDDRQRVVDGRQPQDGRARANHQARLRGAAAARPRHGVDSSRSGVATLLGRPRDVRSSIDARLQQRVASALAGRHRARRACTRRGRGARRRERRRAGIGELSMAGRRGRQHAGRGRRVRAGRRCAARSRRGTACIRQAPRSSCSSPAPRCAAARRSRRQTFVCVRLPDGRVGQLRSGLDAAGARRRDGHRAARRRRPAGTASSSRATPTLRSSRCDSVRGRCWMPRRFSRSSRRGRRRPRRCATRCRMPATARPTCSPRR